MTEGRGVPEGPLTAHYYVADWSLCRRSSPGPAVLRAERPARVCGQCRKAADVLRAVGQVERVKLD